MKSSEAQIVELRPGARGGLAVPLDVLQLAWGLEARGFTMRANADKLSVTATSTEVRLSAEDRKAITTWKPHLLALLAYNPPDAV